MILTSFLFSVSSKHFNAKSKHAYHCQVISMSKYGQVLLGVLDSIYVCFVFCGVLLISNLKHTQKIVTLCNVRRFFARDDIACRPKLQRMIKDGNAHLYPTTSWSLGTNSVFPPSTFNFLPRFWKDKFWNSSPVHVKSLQVPGVVSSCSCTKTSQFGSTWRAKKMDMIDESGVWNPEIRIGHKQKYLGCSLVWENHATLLRKFQGFVINTKVYENGVRQNSSTSSSEKSWVLNQSDLQIASKNNSPLLKPPFLQKDRSLHQGKSWEFSNPRAFGASLRSAINAMNLSCFLGRKESWNHWFPQIDSDQVRAGYQDFSSFASLVHPAKLRLNTQLPKKCQSSAKIKVQSSTNHAWSYFHLQYFNPWNPDFSISLFKGHVAITVLVHLHRGFQKGPHILEIEKLHHPTKIIRINESAWMNK